MQARGAGSHVPVSWDGQCQRSGGQAESICSSCTGKAEGAGLCTEGLGISSWSTEVSSSAPSPGAECRAHPLAVLSRFKAQKEPESLAQNSVSGPGGELAQGGEALVSAPHILAVHGGPASSRCTPHRPRPEPAGLAQGLQVWGRGWKKEEREGREGGGTSGGGAEVPTRGGSSAWGPAGGARLAPVSRSSRGTGWRDARSILPASPLMVPAAALRDFFVCFAFCPRALLYHWDTCQSPRATRRQTMRCPGYTSVGDQLDAPARTIYPHSRISTNSVTTRSGRRATQSGSFSFPDRRGLGFL